MPLAYTFIVLLRTTILITFFASLVFCFRKYNPRYLRLFPIYHLAAIITELIVYIYFSSEGDTLRATMDTPYNIFTFFEFVCFTGFILNQLNENKYRLIIGVSAFTYLIISYFLYSINQSMDYPFWKAVLPLNIYYILSCLLYFINTFSNLPYSNLSKEPSFWIVCGIFFYSLVDTPALVYNIQKTSVSNFLYMTVNGTAYILCYLLLLKAYTCKILK